MTRQRKLFVALTVVIVAACTIGLFRGATVLARSRSRQDTMATRAIVFLKELILEYYVGEADEKKLYMGALRGMAGTLDPHTQFLTPTEFEELNIDTTGTFGGLGIEITKLRDRGIVVVAPLPGTPAAKVGLMPGDVIIEIEGESAIPMTLEQAVKKLRGEPGTKVKIKVLHLYNPASGEVDARIFGADSVREINGRPVAGMSQKEIAELLEQSKGKEITVRLFHAGGQEEDVEITRDVIHVTSIRPNEVGIVCGEPRIGYVRVSHFQTDTAESLRKALRSLSAGDGGTIGGLVLDLRGNPGGLLQSSQEVSNVFLDRGIIVSTVGREGADVARKYHAQAPGSAVGFAMAVLIDGGSASASEIVAAALRENGRAFLVGEKSFGKGSVQRIFPIRFGGELAAVKLTVERYETPSGAYIGKTDEKDYGIKPDYEVKLERTERIALARQRHRQHVLDSMRNGSLSIESRKDTDRQLDTAVDKLRELLLAGLDWPQDLTRELTARAEPEPAVETPAGTVPVQKD